MPICGICSPLGPDSPLQGQGGLRHRPQVPQVPSRGHDSVRRSCDVTESPRREGGRLVDRVRPCPAVPGGETSQTNGEQLRKE